MEELHATQNQAAERGSGRWGEDTQLVVSIPLRSSIFFLAQGHDRDEVVDGGLDGNCVQRGV